jgi:putative nucleotidyltransferase with HDIG domain
MFLPIAIALLITLVLGVSSVVIIRRANARAAAKAPPVVAAWEKEGGRDLTMPVGGAQMLVAPPQGARMRPQTPSLQVAGALLDDVARGLERVPPFPHAVLQIMGELDSAGSSAKSVAEILSTEPVLTAALLRIANSAQAGLRRNIVTVADAVAYLGFSTVKALLLRLRVGSLFREAAVGGAYDSQKLWTHSMAVAQVAEELAMRAGRADPQLALTAGLLHDIGKVAINSQFPETVGELWKGSTAAADESFLARERRLFGADHAAIGGHLARNWRLPAELVEMVRLHHLPAGEALDVPAETRRALFAVYVANQLVKYAHVYCEDMEIDIIPGPVMTELGLPTETERLLDGRMKRIIERATALGAGATEPGPARNAA